MVLAEAPYKGAPAVDTDSLVFVQGKNCIHISHRPAASSFSPILHLLPAREVPKLNRSPRFPPPRRCLTFADLFALKGNLPAMDLYFACGNLQTSPESLGAPPLAEDDSRPPRLMRADDGSIFIFNDKARFTARLLVWRPLNTLFTLQLCCLSTGISEGSPCDRLS